MIRVTALEVIARGLHKKPEYHNLMFSNNEPLYRLTTHCQSENDPLNVEHNLCSYLIR